MRRAGAAIVFGVLLLAANVIAAKQPEQYADLEFIVLKDENGKPIRNAAVVLHGINKQGRQESGGFELKTDAEGKASYSGVPYGKWRIQVIASGFQTYGDDFTIAQPKHEITIKLKRPQQQYSIYDK